MADQPEKVTLWRAKGGHWRADKDTVLEVVRRYPGKYEVADALIVPEGKVGVVLDLEEAVDRGLIPSEEHDVDLRVDYGYPHDETVASCNDCDWTEKGVNDDDVRDAAAGHRRETAYASARARLTPDTEGER